MRTIFSRFTTAIPQARPETMQSVTVIHPNHSKYIHSPHKKKQFELC